MKTGANFNVGESDISYEFIRNFLNTIPGNVIVLDKNGKIVCTDNNWNSFADKFGFSKRLNYNGADFSEIVPANKFIYNSKEIDISFEIKNLLQGESKQFDFEYATIIGDRNFRISLVGRTFNHAGNNWVTLTYLDITNQKIDKSKYLSDYDEFRVTFDQIDVGIAKVSFNGRFLNVNKKFCKIMGYSHNEMLELTYKEITYFKDIELYSSDIEQLINGIENSFIGEKRYQPRSGEIIWGKITISLIRKKSGEPNYLLVVFEDVSDRVEIENAFHESQISYKNLVEQAQDGIALLQNDKVKFVNSALLKLGGYSNKELIGKPFVSFISDDELIRVKEIHRKRLNNEEVPSLYETAIKTKNGSRLDVEFNSQLSDIEGIQIIMIRDISSRKKEENKRKRIFDELQHERNLFISGPVVVFKWSNSAGHPTEYVSPNVYEVFGYKPEELTSGSISYLEMISDLDIKRVMEEDMKREKIKNIEDFVQEPYRVQHKNGEIIWVLDHTSIIRDEKENIVNYLGYVVDITEQKKMEDALRNSEFKYRTLLENIPQKIFLKDKNSVYISCNQNYADDLGIHSSEIMGKTDYEFFPARFAEKFQTDDKRIIKNGQTEELVEEYLHFGKVVLNRVIKTPVKNDKGETEGVLGIFWDITEQNRTEELLRESEEKFRTLVTNIEEVVYILDNDGKFLLSEGKGLSKLGLEPAEVIGESIYQLYKNFPEILSNAEKALKGETVTFEARVSGRHYRNWYTPHRGQGGEILGLLGLSVDLTEQVEAKKTLESSEERLSSFIESATEGFALFDSNFKLIKFNKKTLKIFSPHIAKNICLGNHINKIAPYLTKTDRYKKYLTVMKSGKSVFFEDVVLNEKISNQALNIKAFKVGGGIGMIFQDITESKIARLKLKGSEEKYRELIEQSKDGVALVQNRKIIFTNSAIFELLGYTRNEFKKLEFVDIAHPDELLRILDFHKRRMNNENLPSIYETKLLKKDGSILEVEFNVAKTTNSGEDAILIMARDISERKKIEIKIANYQARLKALASELIVIEEKQRKQIATDLHDHVGQLLASSRLQMAAISNDMDKEIILSKIKGISQGMLQAIQSIRNAIFNLSPPQLNEIGLFAATSDWLEDQIELKHGIKTILRGDDRFFELKENTRLLIFRSVRELLMNIVKHAQAKNIIVTINEINRKMHISIEDDGVGFDYDAESFKYKRKSLGLFSIYERVTDIGGSMEIDSIIGRGTIIKLVIPIND